MIDQRFGSVSETFWKVSRNTIDKNRGSKGLPDMVEKALLLKYQVDGCIKCLHKVIESNLLFFASLATKYKGQRLETGEIVSLAVIGLTKAADKFKVDSGMRFLSYAVWQMRASILSDLQGFKYIVSASENFRSNVGHFWKIRNTFIQKSQREPTNEELACLVVKEGSLQYNYKKSASAKSFIESCLTPNVCMDRDETGGSYGLLKSKVSEDFDNFDKLRKLQPLISELSETEEMVIYQYFGLGSLGYCQTLDDISKKIGVTREGARVIKNRALRRLKRIMGAQDTVSDYKEMLYE